jgi:predicted small lipoprotein YifL
MLLTAVILLALNACGLKGDLYLATPEDKAEDTTETLPPMPEVDTSMDDTGSSVAEDLEVVENLDATESKDTDVLGDAPPDP